MARISHLPHLLAVLMAGRLADAPSDHLALSGQGVRDVTRVAGSDPLLWQQIVTGNAEAVLDLVAASGSTVEDLPWLSELALRDDEDGYSIAAELLVPGAPLADLLAEDAPFGTVHEDLVHRHGIDALRAGLAVPVAATLLAAVIVASGLRGRTRIPVPARV